MRAKILLGCYRTGDANDPETYVAAVTAVLAHYQEEVITEVTHPVTGLPSKKGWLPTVKEVSEACAAVAEPIARNEERLKQIKAQMEAREMEARGERPTIDQMKSRYGENWGMTAIRGEKTNDVKAEETKVALEQARERVRFEYEQLGMVPPSKFALSPTALRDMAERDAVRTDHPETQARRA